MINLDLNKLDQDKIRKQKRKKLLLIAIAPTIILLVLGIFFIRPAFSMMLYNMNYSGKNYSGAESVAESQNFINIIEPFIADYHVGTALLQDAKYEEAEKKLISSLEQGPDKENICKVRTNLGYSVEKQADQLAANNNYPDAIIKYSEAIGYLNGDDCANQQSHSASKDKKAQESMERSQKKLKDLVEKLNEQAEENKPSEEEKYHDGQYNNSQVTEEELENLTNNNALDAVNNELYGKVTDPNGPYSFSTLRCDSYAGDICY